MTAPRVQMLRRLPLALLALLLTTGGASSARPGEDPPGTVRAWVHPDSLTGDVQLPRPHLDPATLRLITPGGRDTLGAGQLNDLDPTTGRFTWPDAPPDSILAIYRALPPVPQAPPTPTPLLSAGTVDSLLAGRRSALPPATSPLEDAGAGSRLRRSGHILRGVQVGTGRALSLESGLHLRLEGRIARGVEVNALLDDRNLPIQPEGTSRRLDEIDQVYVDLTADRARGRFGDYRLRQEAGRYGTVDRRLEGGRVSYQGPDVTLGAAAAVTRTVLHRMRFLGREGVQGPYLLTGQDGETDILVLAGSEQVWVDGVPMQRGETGDYVMDYSRGELTFTPNRPITSESRIEVQYQYSPEAWPRNLYAADAAWRDPSGRYRAAFSFLQEGDDPDRPIDMELTPEMRSALASARPDVGRVPVPAADSLGPGEADYVRVDTTWTDGLSYTIFRFVPPAPDGTPRGSWSVPFSEVGAGEGAYERSYDAALGAYRFRWVGPGMGSWDAVRLMPLPGRTRHAAMALRAAPDPRLDLTADMGLSGQRRNLFAPGDGPDRVGLAQRYAASLRPFATSAAEPGPLDLEIALRDEEASYTAPDRTREVEYERAWGLDTLAGGVRERERTARLSLRPASGVDLRAGFASLRRGEGDSAFSSERIETSLALQHGALRGQGRIERILSDDPRQSSDWRRARGDLGLQLAGMRPGIEGEWEWRDRQLAGGWDGHEYSRLRANVTVSALRAHRTSFYGERSARSRQVGDAAFQDLYDALAYGGSWDITPARAPWRGRVVFHHRERDHALPDSADVTSNLASITGGWHPWRGALSVDLNWRLNRTTTRASALIAYPVPAGQGDYIRVDGQYIYDPEIGDIILRSEPTGDARPTTDLASALRVDWSPHRLPGEAGRREGFGWEDVSLVTELEAVEVTRWDRPAEIILLNPSALQTDSTITGRLLLRQDVYLFRSRPGNNLRLRYEAERRLNNLYLTGAERVARNAWELRSRSALGPALDMENEARWERLDKNLAYRSSPDELLRRRLSAEAILRAGRAWTLRLRARGLLDSDVAEGADVAGLGITPGVTLALRSRGRITASFEALWIETDLSSVPYELADGRPKGRNGRGNLHADWRLGEHLTARAVYTVRLDQGREPLQVARVEMDAFF